MYVSMCACVFWDFLEILFASVGCAAAAAAAAAAATVTL